MPVWCITSEQSESNFLFFNTQIDFRTQTLNTLDLGGNQIGAEGAKDVADALRVNRVSPIFSSSTQIDFFTQTLNTLDLGYNKIGDEGAKCLSDALRVNRVSRIFSSSTQIDFFTQTLNILNLKWNGIGDQGAEHLSAALRNNMVSRIFSSSTQIDFFTQTLTTLDLDQNQIGDKLMHELDDLIDRNRRNAKWWTIELRLAYQNNDWMNILFFFRVYGVFEFKINFGKVVPSSSVSPPSPKSMVLFI